MKLKEYQRIHIIGCGGAGCSPLARLLHEKGYFVTGSDMIRNNNTHFLEEIGVHVAIGHSPENVPYGKDVLVIRTSAAGPENPERTYAEKHGIPVILRGHALSLLADTYECPIAVSGSHGKTSVTAMIAWCLHELGCCPGVMIGGNISGCDFNGAAGNGKFFVTEADESDSTHALLHPSIGIVTNLEDDHAWSVGGVAALEKSFEIFGEHSRKLIYGESAVTRRVFSGHRNAENIDCEMIPDDIPEKFAHFMRVDMTFAVQALEECGIAREKSIEVLRRFPGVERRLSVRKNGPIPIIEDYAHHPTELRESIRAMRELYPGKRLLVVFQPHRYARLERYFSDFVQELRNADMVYVTPVFAAWTGIGKYASTDLAAAVGGQALNGTWDAMGQTVAEAAQIGDVIAIIGAGDLPQILPSLTQQVKCM